MVAKKATAERDKARFMTEMVAQIANGSSHGCAIIH
ncbi:hypothetical protein TM5383_01162 [Thalassovita mediterranea]|uniref:Uncharacterized protein n=1 Tax=Thalassovita mediterranea TaxID=340021 RepID=A0A0P1HAV9_9RHOB|nr:hypothetical protein TM5383_01162 [Thalassovita mediterranea]SIS28029.1 hypothetical protein SAMN05421685_101351 [Thalassovita mediterranea]